MAKVQKTSFAARLGEKARKGFDAHKGDETNYGNIELPSGIEGGIAQLVDCKFGVVEKGQMKGKDYFYAAGVVKTPKEVNGIPVEGLRTSIMEMLCDTPGRARETVADHLGWVLNELRKLGVDTADLSLDDLEGTVEALKEAAPHFRFRTWKGEKQTTGPFAGREPRVNHQWNGICEFDGEASDDVDDQSADSDDSEPEAEPEEKTTSTKKPGTKKAAKKEATPTELAELADGGDEEAAVKLTELAEAADVDPEEYDTWAALAEVLEGGEGGDDDESDDDEPDAEEINPEKGDVFLYKRPGAKKGIECEVTAVFPGKKLVNLKNLDDGKSYKGVPWDKLEQPA